MHGSMNDLMCMCMCMCMCVYVHVNWNIGMKNDQCEMFLVSSLPISARCFHSQRWLPT